MFLRKKKPKRLYYPVKSKWFTKPRRKPSVKRNNKLFKGGFKGLKKSMKKSLQTVVVVAFFAVLILFLAFSSYFSIKNIEVVRENFSTDSTSIENELKPYIGKNIVFFSRNRIFTTLQNRFPEFESIQVEKVLPGTIRVKLESYPVVANLRTYYVLAPADEATEESFTELSKAIEELSGSEAALERIKVDSPLSSESITDSVFNLDGFEEKEPESVEQKAILNQIGQALFDREENLELFTISIHGLTQPIADRDQVIPKEHMDFIFEAIQYFRNALKLEVMSLDYLPIAREIHLKTDNNLTIWISIDRDYKGQIDKMSTIYEPAELNKEDIAYIDLRIKEKIIYCPRTARCNKTE